MKIVVDTNILISGVFFGGVPKKILTSIVEGKILCFASTEIIEEYIEIVNEMIDRKQGNINKNLLNPLIQTLK